MENFTPMTALVGGILIGLAATILLLFNGRIAGISGIVSGMCRLNRQDFALWRVLFFAGLVIGGFVHQQFILDTPSFRPLGSPLWLLISGGLLVGYGTCLGSGCTSGHGVCGLGRLSKRSLVAVIIFPSCAIVTVFLLRHVLELGL